MKTRTLIGNIGKILKISKPEIRILMYHRVNPTANLPDPHISVSPFDFEMQMSWLKNNHWHVIPLNEAVRQIKSGSVPSIKQVVITFDDGYGDNFEYAYPVLKKYQFPATIFLAVQACLEHPDYLRLFQIKLMLLNNISFGAHTITHPLLTRIGNTQAYSEIIESKSILKKQFGLPITGFAYPGGYFNQIHRQMVIQANYKYALSIQPGGNNVDDDLFALKRTEIARHDSISDFENKLLGGFDIAHLTHQYLNGLYPAPQSLSRRIQ